MGTPTLTLSLFMCSHEDKFDGVLIHSRNICSQLGAMSLFGNKLSFLLKPQVQTSENSRGLWIWQLWNWQIICLHPAESTLGDTTLLWVDSEAWHSAVHGVAKSRTWLDNWTEPLPFISFPQLFVKPPLTITLPFCISFPWEWFWPLSSVQCYEPLSVFLQAFCLPDLIHYLHCIIIKLFDLGHIWMA